MAEASSALGVGPGSSGAVEELNRLVSSTISLVVQFETVLSKISAGDRPTEAIQAHQTDGEETKSQVNALSLAQDSATLIRAHSTKISLFIINEPFTPTAITKVLRELAAGPVPALVSAAQLCDGDRYTWTVRRDLAWRCGRVLREFRSLIQKIPGDGKILSEAQKTGTWGKLVDKGSISVTGILWSACDDVTTLAKLGVAGHLIGKVEQFKDILKDVMEELKEWGEEEDDEDDEHDDDEGQDGNVNTLADNLEATHISDTQAMLDDLMNGQRHIPQDDPDNIRQRLDSCVRRLRMTTLLYQALIKRRLKALPSFPCSGGSDIPSRLDEIMTILKAIPERFGSLAMAFYELEPEPIDSVMDQCFFDAFAAAELLIKPWTTPQDEFSDWAKKFQIEIKKE
jgi:hypothetical protein